MNQWNTALFNAAVAAEHLRRAGCERVAIFDFDVRPSTSGKPHQVKQGMQVPKTPN